MEQSVGVQHQPAHHSDKRQFRLYNIFTVLAMSFGSMSYGYSASVIGSTLAQPSFNAYFELTTRSDAISLISLMNGLYQTGGFLGVFTVSYFADKWGRRTAIGLAAAIILLSGALLAGSVNVGMFIAFRFFNGAGAFMILSAVPIWMNEVVPAKNRGAFVDLHGASLLFGYALSAWLGLAFFHLQDSHNRAWRAPMAIQCLPALLTVIMAFVLPESPRWLLMRDRYDEAKKVLLRMHSEDEALIELAQINAQMQLDRALPNSYWIMFKKPSYRKRSLLAMGTTAAIQFSGILVINNYGPTLYATLGYDNNYQLILLGAWLTLAWGCGCLGVFVIDRISRPRLIGIALITCMACLIVEAALVARFASGNDLSDPNRSGLRAAVAMFFVYVVAYEVGLDGTQFVYLGELFPAHIRPKGMNLGVAMICLMNIIWLQAAPTAFQNIGWKFYLCFIVPGCLAAVGIFWYFPDTKGMPLEEIAAIFEDEDEIRQASLDEKADVAVSEHVA